MKLPKTIPQGRIPDLYTREDAHRIAVKPGVGIFDEYKVRLYPSRASLETFLKKSGAWRALVKVRKPRNMVVYPAFEVEE